MWALHQLTTLWKSSLPGSSVLRNHGERAARPWTAALARHLRHVGYLVVWLVGFSNLVSPNRCHVLDSGEVWLGISEAISSQATWGFGFSRWSNNAEDELWWNGYVESSKLWICLLERLIYVGSQSGGESRRTSHETRVSSQEGNFLVTVRKQLDKATAAFSSTSLGSNYGRCTVSNSLGWEYIGYRGVREGHGWVNLLNMSLRTAHFKTSLKKDLEMTLKEVKEAPKAENIETQIQNLSWSFLSLCP